MENLSDVNIKKFIKRLKVSNRPTELDCKETAKIMMGKYDMSQRAFKELRTTLKSCNVKLPKYEDLKSYCKNLNIGRIFSLHDSSGCKCMGYGCEIKETLELIFSCKEYVEKMTFLSKERNLKLEQFLKSKNALLFNKFDHKRRTLILRETGDNFRAAGRYPTEQTSFSILNIIDLVGASYGQ